MDKKCHCGINGHAINSINCPVHSYTIIKNMEKEYYTIKDEDGVLRPQAYLWAIDENIKYHQPDIDKILKKNKNIKLIKVIIKEVIN